MKKSVSILASLKLGSLATESADCPIDEQTEGFIATGDESKTASAAILEATKESAEIDEDIAVSENFDQAIDNIDDQVQMGEIAVEQNRYTPQLAIIQAIGVRNAVAKVADRNTAKLVVSSQIMPSHESFESDPNAQGRLAVESMKEVTSEFWESAKKQIAAILKKIAEFLAGLFDGAKKLENRATALRKRAGEAQPGKVKVTAANTIRVGNKLGSDATDGYKLLAKAVQDTFASDTLDKSAAALANLVDDAGNIRADGSIQQTVIKFDGGTVPAEAKSVLADSEVSCSKEICGGNVLVTAIGKGAGAEVIRGTRNLISKAGKEEAPAESDALSTSEIQQVLDAVIAAAKTIGEGKRHAAAVDKATKTYTSKFIQGLNPKTGKEETEGDRNVRSIVSAGGMFMQHAGKFRKDLATLALSAGNGICNYAEASMKGSKGKEAGKGEVAA